MEITINDRKYIVRIIPLELSPYTILYADLVKRKPKDIAEAEQIRPELKSIIKIVLSETVSPEPQPEDMTELFAYITNYTTQKIGQQTKLFREPEKPGDTESSGARFTAENTSE